MNTPDAATGIAHQTPMSWLVFARWMIGALLVSFANPFWVDKPRLFWYSFAYFLSAFAIGAACAAVKALFFTPTPISLIRGTLVRATWIVLLLALFGNWSGSEGRRALASARAFWQSVVPMQPMTQADLVARVKTLNASIDRSSATGWREEVIAGPGLLITLAFTSPDYTASQILAARPDMPTTLPLESLKNDCGPNLLKDEILQRGVTRRLIFRGRDGITAAQVDVSKQICERRSRMD